MLIGCFFTRETRNLRFNVNFFDHLQSSWPSIAQTFNWYFESSKILSFRDFIGPKRVEKGFMEQVRNAMSTVEFEFLCVPTV